MSKLISIELDWNREGIVRLSPRNHAGLDQTAMAEVRAYSAPAFLVQQLCVLYRKFGYQTTSAVSDALKKNNYDPKPIHQDLKAARLDIHRRGDAIIATFHPKIKFLSKHAEAGASVLVSNYVKKILQDGVGKYSILTEAILLFITSQYRQVSLQPETLSIGGMNKLAPAVRDTFMDLKFHLYELWRSEQFNNITPEKYQELLAEN